MNYYVYILQCSDKTYYTGITNNLERRIIEHESGINPTCYTFNKRPITLKFYSLFTKPEEAIRFEKKIKGWTKKKKEALINSEWKKLHDLSVCQNTSHFKNHAKHTSTPLSVTQIVTPKS